MESISPEIKKLITDEIDKQIKLDIESEVIIDTEEILYAIKEEVEKQLPNLMRSELYEQLETQVKEQSVIIDELQEKLQNQSEKLQNQSEAIKELNTQSYRMNTYSFLESDEEENSISGDSIIEKSSHYQDIDWSIICPQENKEIETFEDIYLSIEENQNDPPKKVPILVDQKSQMDFLKENSEIHFKDTTTITLELFTDYDLNSSNIYFNTSNLINFIRDECQIHSDWDIELCVVGTKTYLFKLLPPPNMNYLDDNNEYDQFKEIDF